MLRIFFTVVNACIIIRIIYLKIRPHTDYIQKFVLLVEKTTGINFDILLTMHLSIFISVINQLDAQNFCFAINLFNASTCFEHIYSKHVEA